MINVKETILELSQNCNLSCIMCGFGKENNRQEKFMPYDSFVDFYHQIKPISKMVRLNGRGESTIHPRFNDMLKLIGKDGMPVQLFTNGNYNNAETNALFLKYNVQLYFSVDSPNKKRLESIRSGLSYTRLMRNLEALSILTPRPFIVFTLQEENIEDIETIASFSVEHNCQLIYNVVRKDEGIKSFKNAVEAQKMQIIEAFTGVKKMFETTDLTCLIPDQIAGVPLDFKHQTTYGSKTTCPALENELTILYDGTIIPCNMFNPYEYGNLNKESLDGIWYGEKRREFLLNHKKHDYCKNCACLMEEV